MWRYSDFLAISEDFIPVFSEDVDRNHQGNWKFFIPHAQMRNLLETLIIALERGDAGKTRSLWLTGAYGTGKTFASFVIKHLLEDDLEAIGDYFQKHQILTPLWPRFKALRQNNRYLVVYRSASGHITSSRSLMIEVQQAIKDQLRAQGYTNAFSESLMDQLVNKLSDPSGIFNWEAAFTKYRGRFRHAATAAEVIEGLRAGDVKLGEQVAAVLEEEGLALADSPASVKAWIKEVIAANNLQGIIFIWDEFTEFFANNVPVTPLQELAQATADMPFYLFLITHRALNQFTRIDEDTRKKILDRFHNCWLEMTPVTAYKLIANVIEAYPERRKEWQAKLDSLWSQVDVAVLHIYLLGERVNKDDLKAMAPIHPFTAYLLATISRLYSSSQRTLFQFLKTDAPGSFQWFIANYPQDQWYWLTPDYLWQYFFEDVKIESIEAISDLLSYYHSVSDNLSEEELRVFRVMLLLIALWRQTQGTVALLKPSLSILKRMFVGTELYQRVEKVADSLCSRGIMLAVPAGNDCEYLIPTTTIDREKLEECRRRAEATLTFEKMIKAGDAEAGFASELKGLLSLQGAAKLRHPVQIVSARELKLRRERVLQGVERPYEIGVILVVAQEDEHLIDSEEIAAEISAAYANYCILISQTAFGSRRWGEWIDHQAHSWYHQEMRDSKTQKYYDTKAKNIAAEWLAAVRTGRIRAFFQGRQEELNGCEVIADYLGEIVASVFCYGPEKLSKTSTLYDHSWGRAGAEIGLGVAQNIQQPYKNVVNELKAQGFWDSTTVDRPGHPLSEMQRVVNDFFASQDHVSLKQVWEALQQPPYGLMPSPIGILLFAFLMRNYAQGYYYSDGTNSLPLNPNKLAELVEQVMKGFRLADNYTIRKMSPQGESFCQMARDVFHLTQEQAAYPEEARKNIRQRVIEIGYPLWAFVYYIQGTAAAWMREDLAYAVEKLSEILAYNIIEELGDRDMEVVVDAVKPVRRELSRLFSRDRAQEGMKKFLAINAPELTPLMAALNLNVPQVMNRLRSFMEEDVYLWSEERVKEKLPEVVRNLDLVDALNKLCGVEKQDLSEVRNYFCASWFKGKLPLLCYKEEQPPEIASLIDYLYELLYHRPVQSIKENRANDIRRLSNQLVSLLNDGPAVAGALVRKYTGQSLSPQEATELYAALPDLSRGLEDDVRPAIMQALVQQARQKKIAQLQKRWRELTRSDSPERWSEERGTPIQWVLEGADHHEFLVRYRDISKLPEKEIDAMMDYLNKNAAELARLQNQQYVLDRFVQAAAGDYADLVLQTGMAEQLQVYIRKNLNGSVYGWPMRLSEIQKLVRQWVTANYQVTAYPQVLKAIDAISPDEMKQFIKQLAADDALVGARLLAILRKEAR